MGQPAENTPENGDAENAIASALRTLELESAGVTALQVALRGALSEPFSAAVKTIRQSSGRVIVTGIGKSGHVGQKIAATRWPPLEHRHFLSMPAKRAMAISA